MTNKQRTSTQAAVSSPPPAPKKAGAGAVSSDLEEPTQQELRAEARRDADAKHAHDSENETQDQPDTDDEVQEATTVKVADDSDNNRQELDKELLQGLTEEQAATYASMSEENKKVFAASARQDLILEQKEKKIQKLTAQQDANTKALARIEERQAKQKKAREQAAQARELELKTAEVDKMNTEMQAMRDELAAAKQKALEDKEEQIQRKAAERAQLQAQLQAQKDKEQRRAEARKAKAAAKRAASTSAASLPLDKDVLRLRCTTPGCENKQQGGASSWSKHCAIECKMVNTAGLGYDSERVVIGAQEATAMQKARQAKGPPSAAEAAATIAAAKAAAQVQAQQQASKAAAALELSQARATQRAKDHCDKLRHNAISAATFMEKSGAWIEALIGSAMHGAGKITPYDPEQAPDIKTMVRLAKLGATHAGAMIKPFMIPADNNYEDINFQTKVSECTAHHLLNVFQCDPDTVTEIVTAQLRHTTARAVLKNCNITTPQIIKLHINKMEEILVAAFQGKRTPGLHTWPEDHQDQLAKEWDILDQQKTAAAAAAAKKQQSKKRTFNKANNSPKSKPTPNAKRSRGMSTTKPSACGVLYIGKRCKRTDCPCTSTFDGNPNEYCCVTCREGERCDKNYHKRPVTAPGDCNPEVMLYNGPACVNKHCHCTASWSGRAGEYCTRACQQGNPCGHNVHTTPAKTKLWWPSNNLNVRN